MGLPLPECTQQFSYMKKTLREELFDSMLTHGTRAPPPLIRRAPTDRPPTPPLPTAASPLLHPLLRLTPRSSPPPPRTGPAHGLPDLAFTSFKRVTNYTSELTAADVVSAVTAQLEGPDGGDARHSAFALARRALGSADLAEPAISEALEKAKSLQEVRETPPPTPPPHHPPPPLPFPPALSPPLTPSHPLPPSPRRS